MSGTGHTHPGDEGGGPRPDWERGRARMEEVHGFSVDPGAAEGDFLAYTVEHLFGDVWSRPALTVAARRLLTVGAHAAQGHTDLLEVQFAAALANGELTAAGVREVVFHLSHYAGWGVGAKANNAAEAAIARHRGDGVGG